MPDWLIKGILVVVSLGVLGALAYLEGQQITRPYDEQAYKAEREQLLDWFRTFGRRRPIGAILVCLSLLGLCALVIKRAIDSGRLGRDTVESSPVSFWSGMVFFLGIAAIALLGIRKAIRAMLKKRVKRIDCMCCVM
jgi:hypothetical protein